MPNEDEPKLKMQSIEATLGINELAEVKRKVELAKKQEQEQIRKAAAVKGWIGRIAPIRTTCYEKFRREPTRTDLRKVDTGFICRRTSQGGKRHGYACPFGSLPQNCRCIQKMQAMMKLPFNIITKPWKLKKSLGKQKDVSAVYEEIADTYYNSGDFQSSITSYEKSLTLKEKVR